MLICSASQAREFGVLVRDQEGVPVQDAVVTLRPVAGAVPPPISGATAVMDQRGKIFVPRVLVVRTGTRVEFPNSDRVRHHVYSFSPPKPFELKLYSKVEIPAVTFDRPGAVSLGCNIHDWMQGYIYVTDDPWFALSAADGVIRFPDVADGEYQMHIWHPRLRGPYLGETYALHVNGTTPMLREYAIGIRSSQSVQRPPAADLSPAYGSRF